MKSILLMFSGGLDSLAALYLLLTDPKYAEYSIHVHHVEIINKEDRHIAERCAVQKIINYLHVNKYREFQYSESSVVIPSVNGNIPWDTDITSFISGYMASFVKFDGVAFGVNKDEALHVSEKQSKRAEIIFESFSPHAIKIFPIVHMTKKEIFEFLPKDLSAISWSCRTPVYKDGQIIRCNKCKTCRALSRL